MRGCRSADGSPGRSLSPRSHTQVSSEVHSTTHSPYAVSSPSRDPSRNEHQMVMPMSDVQSAPMLPATRQNSPPNSPPSRRQMTAGADSPSQEFDLAMRNKSRNQQTQTRRAASNSECSSPPDHGKLVHRSAGSSPSSSPSLSPRTPHPWQQHLHYPRTPLIDDAEPESPNESETFTSHFTINSPRLSSPQSSPGVLSPMPFLSGRGLSPAASISLESAVGYQKCQLVISP